jgi:tetratricopeptide (TPR) repeat protein
VGYFYPACQPMTFRAGHIKGAGHGRGVGPFSLVAVAVGLLISSCAEVPPQLDRPPSASDLVLLKSARLCDQKAAFLQARQGLPLQRVAWGSGEEVRIPKDRSESGADESFFFDQDGLLVGALFLFPGGRELKPFPVLQKTLSALPPTVEFYLPAASIPGKENSGLSVLFMTGDEKTTTQYVIQGAEEGGWQGPRRAGPPGQGMPMREPTFMDVHAATLLLASAAIDPYATLLSPYRKEFLSRIASSGKTKGGARSEAKGAEDKEPFLSLQQFARGETAQLPLGYCGEKNYDVAVEAYRKAIVSGFSDKAKLSEAHHKLGLALKKKGQLPQARDAMQESLAILPNRPDVLNNLGDVYWALGEKKKAFEAFERSVSLRPNYPIARFNLAKAYEEGNPKLAISEYETYLALAEGIPEEDERAALARRRVAELRRP